MSTIIRQIEELKEFAKINAEWQDLVSVEEIAQKTCKSIRMVKNIMEEKNIQHRGKFGKSYLYSKAELLKAIKQTA